MGRIAGIQIKNYGSLKDIKMGKLLFDSDGKELTNIRKNASPSFNYFIGKLDTFCGGAE